MARNYQLLATFCLTGLEKLIRWRIVVTRSLVNLTGVVAISGLSRLEIILLNKNYPLTYWVGQSG